MRDEQGWHATDCQPIVSRRSIRVRQIHKRVKTLRILVGATGFEPATPCAQGRCATRLRYAPTLRPSILLRFAGGFLACFAFRAETVPELSQTSLSALGWLATLLGRIGASRRHRALYVLANPVRPFVIVNVPSCATEALIQ